MRIPGRKFIRGQCNYYKKERKIAYLRRRMSQFWEDDFTSVVVRYSDEKEILS